MIAWLAISQAVAGDVASVVIYPDRAAVTREIEVELVQGANQVWFEDLPPTVIESTLQAAGAGVPGARVLGLDIRSRELAEDRRVRVSGLEEQIEQLSDRMTELRDRRDAAHAELSFLGELRSASAGQLSSELLFAPETAAKADSMAALLRKRIPETQKVAREVGFELRELENERSARVRELSTVRGASQWSRRDVSVEVESPASGAARVSLTYVVPGASWEPLWEVRADPAAGRIEARMSAAITQVTGEDWTDVGLELSTARPADGIAPPEISPFYLYPEPTYEYYGESDKGGDWEAEDEESAAFEDLVAVAEEAPMQISVASVTERTIATGFGVAGKATISPDGTRRKVAVVSIELEAEFIHVAVPSRDEAAWLVARAEWSPTWPRLGGASSSFLDGAFVGSEDVPTVGSGGEVRFAFGMDTRVSVEQKTVEDYTSVVDWLGRITRRQRWLLHVKNGREQPITLEIRDRFPVARDARYVVKVMDEPPDEHTGEGLATWERILTPQSELELPFGYQVRYPRRAPPAGL